MNIMPHITRQFCFMHLSNIINSLIYIYIITNIRNWSFWKRGKNFFFFLVGGVGVEFVNFIHKQAENEKIIWIIFGEIVSK